MMITKQRIDELFTYKDGMFFHKAVRRGVPVAEVEAPVTFVPLGTPVP